MKEYIDTVPLHEAFDSADECPFCYLERMAENKTVRYVLGPAASYMEPDVRAQTDKLGFCKAHFKKMYDYGNGLGNALILQTYYASLLEQLQVEIDCFELPEKKPLLGAWKGSDEKLLQWAREKQGSCFVCQRLDYHMDRYFTTFFVLLKHGDFRKKVEQGKGFCMRHFITMLEQAHHKLPKGQREWFYDTVLQLMLENLSRVKGDIDGFVGMFDYRQVGKAGANTKDAVSRAMEKLQGLHPADPPYRENR